MAKEDSNISMLEDLDKLRSAPQLSKGQSEILLSQAINIVHKADWLTIGVMSSTLTEGINAIRSIEKKFKYQEMKCVNLPTTNGPTFLKANQSSGEIYGRIEYGIGEGVLITCHKNDTSLTATTIGPFPLDFFN